MRCALTILLLLLAACGSGGNPPGGVPPSGPVAVSLSPLTSQVMVGSTRQFTATVTGGGAQGPGGVTWAISGGQGIGSIDSTGLYTAPTAMPTNPQVIVTATSTLDPTVSATATVILVPAPTFGDFPVVFDVMTQGGWQAAQAPVTFGAPLPIGLHSDAGQLRIHTQGGLNVPAQFRVTSRWPDGSIRWVLCDFIADLSAATGSARYQLNNGGTGSAPPGTLQVVNGASDIEVRTGVLTFNVSKTAFRLLESVRIDRDNDGQVDDECLDTATARGIVIRDGVNEYRMDSLAPTRVAVEESGPIRVTLVAEGVHHNAALAQTRLDWIVRLTAWRGLPLVKLSYTFRNRTGHGVATTTAAEGAAQLAQFDVADAVELELPLATGAATTQVVLGGHPGTHPLQVLGGSDFVALNQGYSGAHDPVDPQNPQPPGYNAGTGAGSSEPLTNVWPTDTAAQISYTLDGTLTGGGERAPGWMQLAGTQMLCTVAVRDFWQQYPKQLHAQADGVARVGLWPRNTWPLQVFAGAMKTHDLMLGFDRTSSTSAPLAQAYAAMLNDPPLAVLNPRHVSATRVLGQIGVTDAVLQSTIDIATAARPQVAAYMAEVISHNGDLLGDQNDGNGAAAGHQYGMWNWGDSKLGTLDPGWANNEWEVSRAALAWFMASGNMGMFRLFDLTARHFRDVDVLHADIGLRFNYTEPGNPAVSNGKASMLGQPRYAPGNKQHQLGRYHFGDPHLDVLRGSFLAEHYLMTGDALSLDVLKEIYIYLRGTWKRHFDAANGGVDSTNTCPVPWLSNALYLATACQVANGINDPSTIVLRNYTLAVLRARQALVVAVRDPQGNGFCDANGDFTAWQIGHVFEALEYTRWHANDSSIDDNILRGMNWLLGTNAAVYLGNSPFNQPGRFAENPGGTTDYGGPNLLIGAGFVGALRGGTPTAWQTRAQNLLAAQTPWATSLPDAAIHHASFAQLFRAGPLILGTLRQ